MTYYFTSDGSPRKNLIWKNPTDNRYYYSTSDGTIYKNGWAEVDGNKYYFNKRTGTAANGPIKIGDYYYVFRSSGEMITNQYYTDNKTNKRYTLASNGRSLKGVYPDLKGHSITLMEMVLLKQDSLLLMEKHIMVLITQADNLQKMVL